MAAAVGGAGVRAGGPAARRPRRAAPGDGEAGRGARRRHRRRRGRVRRGRAGGRGAGLPRARRPGPRPARLGHRQGRADRHRRQLVEHFLTQFYGEQAALAESADDAGQPVPREILVPELPADVDALTEWLSRAARLAGAACGSPQRGDKRALAETVARNAARRSPSTSCAGPATSPPARRRWRRSRTRSGWTARRCASSASTSRTCRAPTWSPRWWCSRTGWPASRTTAASRSATARRAATSPRSPRSCAGGSAATSRETAGRRDSDGDARSPTRSAGVTSDPPRSSGSGDAPDRTRRPARPGIDPTTGRPRQFAYPPNLLVVDGGHAAGRRGGGRAGRARHRRRRRLRAGQAAGGGLAAGRARPGDPPAHQRGLYLLQRVRDEAHRFAITYHRQRRSKCDDGLRAGRRARARARRGGGAAQALRLGRASCGRPSVEEIAAVPGFGAGRPRRSGRAAGLVGPATRCRTGPGTERRMHGRASAAVPTGERPPGIEVALVTGLSGAGRSTAAKCWRTSAGSSWTTCRPS